MKTKIISSWLKTRLILSSILLVLITIITGVAGYIVINNSIKDSNHKISLISNITSFQNNLSRVLCQYKVTDNNDNDSPKK
ncbi:MAG: hypothetical protein GY863_05890, partial [bacterium]|nr:hypothetical protein [bacterium]